MYDSGYFRSGILLTGQDCSIDDRALLCTLFYYATTSSNVYELVNLRCYDCIIKELFSRLAMSTDKRNAKVT